MAFSTEVLDIGEEYRGRGSLLGVFRRKDVWGVVLSATSFLPEKATAPQRFWHIWNQEHHIPKCHCGKALKWDKTEYRKFCSPKCSAVSADTKDQRKRTNRKRFGHDFASQSSDKKEKAKMTFQERYGVDNPSQVDSIKKKRERTFQERFNTSNPFAAPEIKEKIKRTHRRKRGVDNPQQDTEIKRRTADVFISNYTQEVTERRERTTLEAHNVAKYMHKHIPEESLRLLNSPDWLKEQHYNKELTFKEISVLLGVSVHPIYMAFKKFNIPALRHFQSMAEKEIAEFLSGLGLEVESRLRSIIPPHELDIYLPDHKVAIEYHGLYWHCESQIKDRDYHRKKWEACHERGIRLIQIFENEWSSKKRVVQSLLRSMFGQSKQFPIETARVVRVQPGLERKFLERNHIQGYVSSDIAYGLAVEKRLVALMSFGKPRCVEDQGWKMLRFCPMLNCDVAGGAARMLRHFQKKHPGSIVSRCDLRWENGDVYEDLGFTFSRYTPPVHWYFSNGMELFPGLGAKKILAGKLGAFDPELTEYENMLVNGYDRIWDCGNVVYVLNK